MFMTRRIAGILSLVLVAGLSLAGASAEFVHGPYSGAPSLDSIDIAWTSEPAVPARVEYGLRADYEASVTMAYSLEVPALEDDPLIKTTHALIEGLDPTSDYVYRVVLLDGETETASPIGAFSTAPNPGETVAFAVLADTQQQLEGTNRLALVCGGIATDPTDFDFILHAGDVVENPSTYYWDDWFDSFAEMLPRAPIIPVLGNHEKNHRSYYDTFELPPGGGKNDERWWALHWGDVVVVGLDSNVKKATDYTLQQEFAREQLSGDELHKFVIFHHPVFTSDAFYGSGSFLDEIFHPIFVELNVDIVFNGHSHHYEHIVRDGVTYMVVGGGGATPRRTRPDHIEGSDVSMEGHHFYARVTTSSDGIAVETISVGRESGDSCVESSEVMDTFVLGDAAELLAGGPGESPSSTEWILAAALLAGLAAVLLILRLRE